MKKAHNNHTHTYNHKHVSMGCLQAHKLCGVNFITFNVVKEFSNKAIWLTVALKHYNDTISMFTDLELSDMHFIVKSVGKYLAKLYMLPGMTCLLM